MAQNSSQLKVKVCSPDFYFKKGSRAFLITRISLETSLNIQTILKFIPDRVFERHAIKKLNVVFSTTLSRKYKHICISYY